MSDIHINPDVRHDALLLFDATNSNPNGDPDAGNQPRIDPSTGHGYTTDVSIKRKIRDTIDVMRPHLDNPDRYGIYVTAGQPLNTVHKSAYEALGNSITEQQAQDWLKDHYYDIRMFGAVMSTGGKNGQKAGRVTGAMQVGFATSLSPVEPAQVAITRVVKTKEGETEDGEMGNKWIIPYGLYTARIHYSPALGKRHGVTAEDLDLFWNILPVMWDHTRTASRAGMAHRGLYIHTHDTALGSAPAARLLDSIRITTDNPTPRRCTDYTITLPDEQPPGITLTTL